jgi:hypothetical protein
MKADYRNIVLDLRDLRLADRDAVRFLRDSEADGMELENCPAYVREWMGSEKIEGRTTWHCRGSCLEERSLVAMTQ